MADFPVGAALAEGRLDSLGGGAARANNSSVEVDIVLATYNGAVFLEEQLDSVVKQTFPNWRVIVRDDGSVDRTANILERYARDFPGKFKIVSGGGRLGARNSFALLMSISDSPYMAFCDQDDVWLPNKLEVLLAAVRLEEGRSGDAIPVLVHSDLEVVDENLGLITRSFWRYQGIEPSRDALPRLLAQNVVTGCAALCNRALVALATPIPEEAIMHDHWLALIASATGRIISVPRALIKYRQHGLNTVGAKKMPGMAALFLKLLDRRFWLLDYGAACAQAGSVNEALSGKVADAKLESARRFARLYRHGWLKRRLILLRYGILPARLRRQLSVLLRV